MSDGVLQTSSFRDPELRRVILAGGIGVVPTDTMYGVSGLAANQATIERIYALRKRDLDKPMIILISEWEHLRHLRIRITPEIKRKMMGLWPGPVSVVLPCPSNRMKYLHRGTKTLAVRWPKLVPLTRLISQVGPIVSTSVNLQGQEPATTIGEAVGRFGNRLDFYIDWRKRGVEPSTLIRFERGKMTILRHGKLRIKN